MEERLTKEEKKALKRDQWQEKAKQEQRNKRIKKYSIWAGAALVVIVAIVGLMWLVTQPTSTTGTQSLNVAPVTKRDISEGSKNAPISFIEYADFECPACAAYHPIINQILATYKDKILYTYRMFPLTQIHPNSHISAQAAYAAYKQGAFFTYDDTLYNNQNDWASLPDPRSVFIDYAKQLKLDVNKFTLDMNSNEAKNYVNDSETQALNEGLNHTPTFFVNGKEIPNPNSFDDFKKIIDATLSKKQAQ